MKLRIIDQGELAKTAKGMGRVCMRQGRQDWHSLELRENWLKYVMKMKREDFNLFLLQDIELDWFLYGRKGISKKTAGKYRRFWRRLGRPLIH